MTSLDTPAGAPAIELWGGPECTVNRVGSEYIDQLRLTGHHERVDDLDRFADLGIRALRYPVLWERHATAHDVVDLSWADRRLHRLRELNVRPIVGLLHHGSGPRWTSLLDPQFPSLLARYARRVAERYPWVTEWTPVNEPLTTARFSALYGHWFPHARGPSTFVRALLNQLRGVVLAMTEIRAINPEARLVQTEDVGLTRGTSVVSRQVDHEQHRRWLTWDLLTGRVDRQHPLWEFLRWAGADESELQSFVESPCPPDIVGLNYYVTSDRWLDHRLMVHPPSTHGGNGDQTYADVEAVRACPQGLVGHGRNLVHAWERYRLPVAITEVHLGCTREEQLRWFAAAWGDALRANADGADVRAVTAWALLGSYDWDSLVTTVRGHYEPGAFDTRGPSPRPTAIASALRDVARGTAIRHPAAEGSGWWERAHSVSRKARLPTRRHAPIVVFGRGTLARAFERVCAVRGLPVHVAGRSDVDITDAVAVDAILRHVEPWAVINATGFVRVDDAEGEREACWRDNVTGPVTLAAACRRRELPLVVFSSDLVFDGATSRSYREEDAPNPLNIYGSSKAAMERQVAAVLADALIVRTSAFFGPWDDANFARHVWRTLEAGVPFSAAADVVVSPTYVPHLVNAVLDLTVDGQSGIWHLVNAGAVTWCDFARAIADVARMPADLVRPARCSEVWGPATRPAFSALGTTRGQLLPSLADGIAAYAEQMMEAASIDHRASS